MSGLERSCESVVDRDTVMTQLGEHEQVYRITQLFKGGSVPPLSEDSEFYSSDSVPDPTLTGCFGEILYKTLDNFLVDFGSNCCSTGTTGI